MGASGLGKILLHEGLIGEKNLKIIEKTCHLTHGGIAKALLTIGLLDEEELASLLVERTQFKRIPRAFWSKLEGKNEPSTYLALPFIEFLEVYPFGIHNGRMDVVMLDPLDYGVSHQVEFFSGHPVRPHIASYSELTALIKTVLPGFVAEEPNLQDFLIDFSVSSAQTLLQVEPSTAAARPARIFEQPLDEPTAAAPTEPGPAPEDIEAELDPIITDDVDQKSHLLGDESPDLDVESDINQDVLDIFAEDQGTENQNALSEDELSRMGLKKAEQEQQPEQPAADDDQLFSDDGEQAFSDDGEQTFSDQGDQDDLDNQVFSDEALLEQEEEQAAAEEEQAATEEEQAAAEEEQAATEEEQAATEEEQAAAEEELAETKDPTAEDLLDDITPAHAPDMPSVELTPVEGAVRALNEGLAMLSLGIGNDTRKAAAATLAKIIPEGKLVRIGGEGGDVTEVLNWQATGEFEVTANEDGKEAEVIDLVARRNEANELAEPEGWQSVEQAETGTLQSTGYVHDNGKTGLYLVAGLEESYCDNETFSHLSKKFLKLVHQKWTG